jgi:hypothetical protein
VLRRMAGAAALMCYLALLTCFLPPSPVPHGVLRPYILLTCTARTILAAHAACPTPAGYTLAAGMDMPGNDITCDLLGPGSPDDLARLCHATTGCVAFNFYTRPADGLVRYCLKHTRTALSDQSITYMKGACQGVYTGAQCLAGLKRAVCRI